MNEEQGASVMAVAYANWGWLALALAIGVVVGWIVRGRAEAQH